jgi:polygalacturonase
MRKLVSQHTVIDEKYFHSNFQYMSIHSILDYGALADGHTNNAVAIQATIDACSEAGGGMVLIPSGGTFICGTISLRDNIELHLENGAKLQASAVESHYTPMQIAGEYGGKTGSFLIQTNDAENVAITGLGTIDGQGKTFMDGWWTDDGPYIKKPKSFRPRLIGFFGCQGIRIRDITIRDAPQWTCHLTGCEDVVVDGITILNGLDIPNCDGIDPDHCRNVRISNCHIEAGDDCIVIKATREFAHYGPSENITVTGCTLISTSAAIKIGTESVSDITDIVVTGCVIRNSHRGLAIQLRDQGNVRDVLFSDCIVETRQFHPKWWGNAEAIYVTATPRHTGGTVGTISGIAFHNIRFRGENGIFLCGTADSPLKDITLDGVKGTLRKTSKFPVDFFDMRPSGGEEHGGLTREKLEPITARHVEGLVMTNTLVRVEAEDPSHWQQL